MTSAIIDPLDRQRRALRELQAPQQIQPASDKPSGFRPSSAAFKLGKDGSMSVDLEESMLLAGVDMRSRYRSLPRAVALVAQQVRAFTGHGMTVAHAPIPANDHHGEVRAKTLTKQALREAARMLADTCEIIEPIDADEVRRQLDLQAQKPAPSNPAAA